MSASSKVLQLRFCQLSFDANGAFTFFNDGKSWGALPHDEPHYHELAQRFGYGDDILRYCQEHELCHHIVAEQFNSHSFVLYALAHGEQPTSMIAAAEEGLVMHMQRYARTGEHPYVAGLDWNAAKDRFFELLGQ